VRRGHGRYARRRAASKRASRTSEEQEQEQKQQQEQAQTQTVRVVSEWMSVFEYIRIVYSVGVGMSGRVCRCGLGWVVACCFSCRQIDGIRRHTSTNRRRCADGTLPASNMRQPPSPHRPWIHHSWSWSWMLELAPNARCQLPVPAATTRASVAPCRLTDIPLHHCCPLHHQVLCPHLPGRDVRKRRRKADAKTTQSRRNDDCTRRET
jgi:hypothetical protein